MTNPAEPDAVYAGSQFVMRSTNGGQSWQRISPDLTYADPATLGDSGGPITKDQTSIEYYATVFSIAPSTVDPRIIWAGSDDGRIHVRNTHGGWDPVTPLGLPKFSRVSMLDASRMDSKTPIPAVAPPPALVPPTTRTRTRRTISRSCVTRTTRCARSAAAWRSTSRSSRTSAQPS